MTSGWLWKVRYGYRQHPVTVVHVVVPDESDLIGFARLALDELLAAREPRLGESDAPHAKDGSNYSFLGVEKVARAFIDEKVMA